MEVIAGALSQLTAGVIAWTLIDLGKFWKSQNYYVNQQVMQMQAHYLNKKALIRTAKGRTQQVVQEIFDQYERTIRANACCWVKTDKLHLVKMRGDRIKTNNGWSKPTCYVHRGFFPPSMPIYESMSTCKKQIDTTNGVSFTENATLVSAWNQMEFLVLQLEALEQDMAAIKL
jgi:hypothetical protein